MSDATNRDELDLSMLDLFRVDAENHARVLEAGLVEVEGDQSPGKIEPLMRAAHSIKGAARIVGLHLAVSLAHAMEDILSAAQQGRLKLSSAQIDLLLRGNDLFSRLAARQAGEIPVQLDREEETIKALCASIQATLLPSPAPEKKAAAFPPEPPATSPARIAEAPGEKPAVSPSAENRGKGDDREVRVLSENLNRLLGLAGECLVQAKSLKPLSASLLKLKGEHLELSGSMEDILQRRHERSGFAGEGAGLQEALRQMERVHELLARHLESFEGFSRRLESLADRLYGEVLNSRMQPFADGLHGFPRMLRDMAKTLGKKTQFSIQGGATRVDRDILEKMEAPLTHLLRNGLDHGLETPEERLAAGKSAEGMLVLEARHVAGMLHVTVSDDGRGIDPEAIRQKVIEKKYISAEVGAHLRPAELMDFLFLPGFSTAKALTEISGRGVGLDVVHSMAQEVGGTVRAESQPGKGTSFHMILPLTRSVLRTLLVQIDQEPYAVPLARIDRILAADPAKLETLEGKQFYTHEGEHIGVIDACQVLQLPASTGCSGQLGMILISDRFSRYGLVVDRFLGEKDLVVIPLDPRLGKVPNITAGAVLDDGSPVLILDVEDLVRSIDNLLAQGRIDRVGERAVHSAAVKKRILVVDDSLTVREVERKLLENRGYEVRVAVDGIDGWNRVQSEPFAMMISDIDMPRMDGIELVRRVKNDPRLKALPVMIVSYKDREEDRQRGLEAGANYYLAKSSFQDETLVEVVRDLIGQP